MSIFQKHGTAVDWGSIIYFSRRNRMSSYRSLLIVFVEPIPKDRCRRIHFLQIARSSFSEITLLYSLSLSLFVHRHPQLLQWFMVQTKTCYLKSMGFTTKVACSALVCSCAGGAVIWNRLQSFLSFACVTMTGFGINRMGNVNIALKKAK